MGNRVYFDYNATSPIRESVVAAMADAMRHGGNPSSVHAAGREARKIVESAREKIAALAGVAANQIIFTSGGTESNNWALNYTGRKRVLISAVEHDSVRASAPHAEIIPVDGHGIVNLDALDRMLSASAEPALVSVMAANNETGVLQPVSEISAIARRHGALMHTDAVQCLGKMPINFAAWGVDMMTLSAHKSGGPQGVGILIFSDRVPLSAMIKGGGQERSRRAGSENVAGIAGFGVLADELNSAMDAEIVRISAMRDRIEQKLSAIDGVAVIAGKSPRLPNTVCAVRHGMTSDIQLMKMDMAGFCISTGAACSSGKVRPSHVLTAMGIAAEQISTAIRISIGWNSTMDEVDRFCAAYASLGKTESNAKSQLKSMTAA